MLIGQISAPPSGFRSQPSALKRTLPPTSVHPPDLYFGQDPTQRDFQETRKKLKDYGAVLRKDKELREYDIVWVKLKIKDLCDCFNFLPVTLQKKIDKTLNRFPYTELEALHNRGLLGIVEESSDMFFELYTLKALKKQMIPQGAELKRWADELFPVSTEPNGKTVRKPKFEHFPDYLLEIEKKLKARPDGLKKVSHFQRIVAPPGLWKKDQSERLLQLMVAKMLLITSRDNHFNAIKDTKALLMGESKELQEKLASHPLRRFQIDLLGRLYAYFPSLPEGWFRSQVIKVVSVATNTPEIRYKHLMKNIYKKQYGRQQFDYATYLNNRFNSNKERKAVLKCFEAVQEGAIFMQARKYGAKSPA